MTDNVQHYYREYSHTHQVYLNRKLKTIENLIDKIPIIEECIGFQVWLDEQISAILVSNEEKFRKILVETPSIGNQIVVGFSLYRRNHQYLDSAYELAYAGLCEPAYNILRTVHESILALWYVATHQNESTDILEYMRDNKREGTRYDHNHFVQSLYTGEMEISMRSIFSGLSGKAHSNIFGMTTTEQYDVKQIKDCFLSIRAQSFYNIISNIENLAQHPDLHQRVLQQDIVTFVERLKNEIAGTHKTIPDYFPNKGYFKEKFYLYRPQ